MQGNFLKEMSENLVRNDKKVRKCIPNNKQYMLRHTFENTANLKNSTISVWPQHRQDKIIKEEINRDKYG